MAELTPERWQVLSPHLDRALELPPTERDAFLAELRAGDAAIAEDVEALLHERTLGDREGFLEGTPSPPNTAASLAGQTLGSYTLDALAGEGGMGSVWRAHRSDGRFEGAVAVKLLSAGLIGRTGEKRFRREGMILARLADPHIARLLDAGVSPLGQPFLVLEYVEGDPIDRYCDERRLGIDARIRLFLDVLEAVAHAHVNLIVHRDIKPANVLVAKDGSAKLLDFGIAKLLEGDAEGGEATALTREAGRALTPQFAAPEQLTGGAVTTATDVYALGTLLYLLLSGRHPAAEAPQSHAELVRAITEHEPQRLSDAVVETRTQSLDSRQRHAAERSATPEALRRTLRGDLDTIVAKALQKSPDERYRSVTALASDLRRYLDHQPISARPETIGYRAAKFLRRNRATTVLGGLVVLALVAGLVGTLSQASRARRDAARADAAARVADTQRDFALRQLSRAEAINGLNDLLLADVPAGKPFTSRDLLARADDILEREGSESPENRAEMMVNIGFQYSRADQSAKARQLLEAARELAARLPDPSLRAKAACALGEALAKESEVGRGEALYQEGLRALPDDPQFVLARISCLRNGSFIAREADDLHAGVDRILQAQRLLRSSPFSSAVGELSISMDVAEAYRMAGRNREAAVAFREASEKMRSLGREDTERMGTLLNNWGLAEDYLGHPLESERLYRQAIRISDADASERSVSPMLLLNLARSLKDLSRATEASRYADRAYSEARASSDEIVVNQALIVRAAAYRELGDFERSAAALAELEPRLQRMLPPGHVAFASMHSEASLLAQARGALQAARTHADRSVTLAENGSEKLVFLPLALQRRSQLELQMHQWEEARSDASRALRLYEDAIGPGTPSNRIGRCDLFLGRALLELKQPVEARAALAAALENLERSQGADHPETREARRLLATATPAAR